MIAAILAPWHPTESLVHVASIRGRGIAHVASTTVEQGSLIPLDTFIVRVRAKGEHHLVEMLESILNAAYIWEAIQKASGRWGQAPMLFRLPRKHFGFVLVGTHGWRDFWNRGRSYWTIAV